MGLQSLAEIKLGRLPCGQRRFDIIRMVLEGFA